MYQAKTGDIMIFSLTPNSIFSPLFQLSYNENFSPG